MTCVYRVCGKIGMSTGTQCTDRLNIVHIHVRVDLCEALYTLYKTLTCTFCTSANPQAEGPLTKAVSPALTAVPANIVFDWTETKVADWFKQRGLADQISW